MAFVQTCLGRAREREPLTYVWPAGRPRSYEDYQRQHGWAPLTLTVGAVVKVLRVDLGWAEVAVAGRFVVEEANERRVTGWVNPNVLEPFPVSFGPAPDSLWGPRGAFEPGDWVLGDDGHPMELTGPVADGSGRWHGRCYRNVEGADRIRDQQMRNFS